MTRRRVIILLSAMMPIAPVWAACAGGGPSEVVVTVDQCELVVPENNPELKAITDRYLKSSRESDRPEAEMRAARLLDSYRGALLVENGARIKVRTFFPSKDAKICSRFKKGQKIRALVSHACCDGDPNPPCYLGLSAYIEKLLPLEGSASVRPNNRLKLTARGRPVAE
jgi:hypothetical protein